MKSVSKHALACGVILMGLGLVLAGALWPVAGRAPWSEQQAEEYAEASAAQMQAAHESVHLPGQMTAEQSAELRATQRRFEKLKADLEAARERPAEVGFWLKAVGGALAAAGIVMLLVRKKPH